MKRAFWLAAASAGIPLLLAAQQSDVIIKLEGGARPAIAAPDLRGSGAAQPLMNAFNETLYNDLDASGIFKMVPKTMYPLQPTTTQRWRRMALGLVLAAGLRQLPGVCLYRRAKQRTGALPPAVQPGADHGFASPGPRQALLRLSGRGRS